VNRLNVKMGPAWKPLLQLAGLLSFTCGTNNVIKQTNNLGFCHFDNTTCSLIQHCEEEEVKANKIRQPTKKKRANPKLSQWTHNITSQLDGYKQVLLNASSSPHRVCPPTTIISQEEVERKKQDDASIKLLNEKEAEGFKKNFASIDCGAKLIMSSESLKHPANLINKNLDEYMLMPCQDQNSFTIELCETTKIVRFELDNFELYSGTTKNFKVSLSTNLKDWVVIGNYEASSNKMEVQNFLAETLTFGKFIRVDINSYHGIEHFFCTVTSFRAFGVSEYEYLNIIDNEVDDEVGNDTDEEKKVESEVENKLNQLTIGKKPDQEELNLVSPMHEQNTISTYKYLFLQMRNDVCVDSATFETFTQSSLLANKDNIESINYKEVEKTSEGNIIGVEENSSTKKETSINVSETKMTPKESILVQISNRVKLLEKNLTSQNNILKTFNSSAKQQGDDIGKILDTIMKAKEVFEETAGDTENVKKKVKKIENHVDKVENMLADSAETMKMMMAITIVLAIICLFLVSIICFAPSSQYVSMYEDNMEVEENEDIFVDNGPASQPSSTSYENPSEKAEVDGEPLKRKKKVTFSEEEMEKGSSAEESDISFRMESPQRRLIKKDPRRRATWCGGSFRKLAEDAAALVAKEF